MPARYFIVPVRTLIERGYEIDKWEVNPTNISQWCRKYKIDEPITVVELNRTYSLREPENETTEGEEKET